MIKQTCEHKHTKKNFPFGRNSGAEIFCKDCKKPLSRWEIRKMKEKEIKERERRERRWEMENTENKIPSNI